MAVEMGMQAAVDMLGDLSMSMLSTRRHAARLLAADGTCVGRIAVEGGDVTVGRASSATVQLVADPYVSALHAVIQWDTFLQMHVISDCDSSNGTYVDDVRVAHPVRLTDGSVIRFGQTELLYRTI